jgi:hypothetical protein
MLFLIPQQQIKLILCQNYRPSQHYEICHSLSGLVALNISASGKIVTKFSRGYSLAKEKKLMDNIEINLP